MITNIRYILLTALRDWLFAALMLGVLACALIAHMLGGTAIIETQEMTLSYTTASARVIIMTGLIVFTCFHVRNAFDTREIDVFLSRPITRSNLVLSYWLGFAAVALLLVIPTIILVAIQGIISHQGFFFWSLSLLIECWLVVAVALFAAFTLKSAVTSVIVSMGFYVLARMMGFFIATTGSAFLFDTQWINLILTFALKIVSMIMPRLDFFAKSDWLIYGLKNGQDLKLFTLQAFAFIPLLILATIADFRRKQF
jgi:ABC-type transport system involved in multi-copper enzyme maturation permease subunit